MTTQNKCSRCTEHIPTTCRFKTCDKCRIAAKAAYQRRKLKNTAAVKTVEDIRTQLGEFRELYVVYCYIHPPLQHIFSELTAIMCRIHTLDKTAPIIPLNAAMDDCVICQDAIDEDCSIRTLACSHTFHANCLTNWAVQSDACPICRAVWLTPDDKTEGFVRVEGAILKQQLEAPKKMELDKSSSSMELDKASPPEIASF